MLPTWSRLLTLSVGLLLAPPASAVQKLPDPDPQAGERFGNAVASGEVLVVGEARTNHPLEGVAHVYRWDGTAFVHDQLLAPADLVNGDRFGTRVALSSDLFVAKQAVRSEVVVYRESGGSWLDVQRLTAATPGFGASLAADGDVLAVGLRTSSLDHSTVHVHRFDGTNWVEEQVLGTPTEDDDFGEAIAIAGDLLAVSAPDDDEGGDGSGVEDGAVYVYRWDGSQWSLEQKVALAGTDLKLGRSVAFSAGFLLAGTLDYDVRVFEWDGSSWSHLDTWTGSPPNDFLGFGGTLASWGNRVAIEGGSTDPPGEDPAPPYHVYVFEYDGSTWSETHKISLGHGMFGDALGLFEDRLLVGAPRAAQAQGADVGTAWIFDLGSCGNGLLGEEACDDGNAATGDGCTPACVIEECSNGEEDDADGLIDYPSDPGCAALTDLSERSPTLPCDDGADNDGDGLIDFPEDPDCTGPTGPTEMGPDPACSNGLDDDGDGLTDFPNDPGCLNAASILEDPACDDELDDDGDGEIDWDGGAGAGTPDAYCAGIAYRNREKPKACGLGFEILAPLWMVVWARRRRATGARTDCGG
ncbi:MAG: hypothetical protein OEP95_09735 [Myxococcales bacterium]|nr:hypothetical protein [Myxococcales bacterium]